MKNQIIILFLLFSCFLTFGQTLDTNRVYSSSIELLLKYEDNKVHLRWAPTSSALWFKLNVTGYKLKRVELSDDFIPQSGTEKYWQIDSWDEEQFRPYLEGDEKYILAAGHCLYGELESTQGDDFNLFGQHQETTNKYSIAMLSADFDSTAASALALGFVDSDVIANKTYLYSIYSAEDSLSQVYRKSVSTKTVESILPEPVIDHVVEEEHHLTVHIDKFLLEEYYTGYWIERSEAGGPFVRLNKNPIIGAASNDFKSRFISFRDSVPQYTKFDYRIIGITPFATLSQPSIPAQGIAKDKTAPGQPQNLVAEDDNGNLRLSWDPVLSPDLSHYNVYRSSIYDGSFEKINERELSRVETFYTDDNDQILQSPYYIVGAVDTAGNENLSLKARGVLRDTLAPSSPIGLTGTIDSNGIVTLNWDQNTEVDLDGYYVYYANNPKDFFTNLTGHPIKEAYFTDTITLKTTTEEIYYRVTATDVYNHISKFSEILELKKPDTIPPFAPSLRNYRIEDDHIKIGWSPSRSKDVAHHRIYRKNARDEQWNLWLENPEEVVEDRDVEYGETYMYRAQSEDDDGNFSIIKDPMVVKFIDKRPIEPPVLSDPQVDTTRAVLLVWEKPSNASKYILYRSIGDGPFVTLERFKDIVQYSDRHRLKSNQSYGYKLKSVGIDGRKSKFSNAVYVTLKNEDDEGR